MKDNKIIRNCGMLFMVLAVLVVSLDRPRKTTNQFMREKYVIMD